MSEEEIKDEFINCIEGEHTLQMALSLLEENKILKEKLELITENIRELLHKIDDLQKQK